MVVRLATCSRRSIVHTYMVFILILIGYFVIVNIAVYQIDAASCECQGKFNPLIWN